MAINLVKGERVSLDSGLTRLKVEMGWKVNPNADPPYDLDASTFLLGEAGQIEKGLHRNDVIPASCRASRRSSK
jgi:stress response protein SCP2